MENMDNDMREFNKTFISTLSLQIYRHHYNPLDMITIEDSLEDAENRVQEDYMANI
jgi:hypothetical protein